MNSLASFIGPLFNYLFLLNFVAAYFLWRITALNRLIAIGAILDGLNGTVRVLVFDIIMRSSYGSNVWLGTTSSFIYLASLTCLVVGAYLSAQGRVTTLAGNNRWDVLSDDHLRSLVTPRRALNGLSVATDLRDTLLDRFLASCARLKVEVVAYKSPALSQPVWAHFEFVLPSAHKNLSLRASCRITVETLDFHRFERLLTIELTEAKRRRVYYGVTGLNDEQIRSVIEFVTAPDVRKAPKLPTVRQHPLQLWRPGNRIDRLHPDWPALGLGALAAVFFLGARAIPIPFVGLLVSVGLIVYLFIRGSRRKTYVLTPGKPLHDPRLLRRFDSWQANIYGLGVRADEVRADLLQRLRTRTGTETQFSVAPERIWYAGVDGKVEREQIVVGYRRAMAFVHVEAHGDDLYVGWDSHVNTGTWVEQTLASGIDRESGKHVVAKHVVIGTQAPNEYDITDTNFLTEWLHTVVTRNVRLKMEEHRIDQEIDFVIQRGSREAVLRGDEGGAVPTRGHSLLGGAKRVA